jgi:hypothetical protein
MVAAVATLAVAEADPPPRTAPPREADAMVSWTLYTDIEGIRDLRFYAIWNWPNAREWEGIHCSAGRTAHDEFIVRNGGLGGNMPWKSYHSFEEVLRLWTTKALPAGATATQQHFFWRR